MTQKMQAIVIKSSDRKEKDKQILLFSIEQGKFWATLKGVKNANAKMKLAQNVFCFGEFVLEDGKMGKIVTGFETIETFHELTENIDKYFEATSILEIVNAMDFSDVDERKNVFVLIVQSLKTLCFENASELYVLDKFLLELLSVCGYPVSANKCAGCGSTSFAKAFYDRASATIVCSGCKGFDCQELSPATISAIKIIKNTSFDRLSSLKLAQGSEFALLKILVQIFENKFEKRLNLIGILS